MAAARVGPSVSAGARFSPRIIGPRVVVGVPFRPFYRPYYAFRPRFSLGLGLFVGFPVAFPYFGYAYPYAYSYPYPSYLYPDPYPAGSYPYPYASNYAPAATAYPGQYQYPAQASNPYPSQPPVQGSVGVASGQTALGGVSFDITPGDAQVYVDGSYMGQVGNFSATSEPLTLTAGRHAIEIRGAGYRTIAFDADVTPGQVIPYQGTMQR